MNITLRQLRLFLQVAHSQSFSRAGDIVGLTQPAVSRAMRELEETLGARLLDRTTREVVLTEAGGRLVGSLSYLLDELDNILEETRQSGEQRRGRVWLATSPTISAGLMPGIIADCRQRYPHIRLQLRDQVQSLVLASVRNGEVDFGIVIEPSDTDDLICEPIMIDPFCLVCRQDHPLASQTAVKWSDLAGEALVLLDYASGSRRLIDQALARFQVPCDVVQDLGHSTTVFRMVEAGIGISIAPSLALPLPEQAGLVSRPLIPEVKRTIMLIRRKNRTPSAVAERVWELIKNRG